jgi:hypothetical protein
MAIKIPSKNIYDKQVFLSQDIKNKFTATIKQISNPQVNVLQYPYNFTFRGVEEIQPTPTTKDVNIINKYTNTQNTQNVSFIAEGNSFQGVDKISITPPYYLVSPSTTYYSQKCKSRWVKIVRDLNNGEAKIGYYYDDYEYTFSFRLTNYSYSNQNADIIFRFDNVYQEGIPNSNGLRTDSVLLSVEISEIKTNLLELTDKEIFSGEGSRIFANDSNELMRESGIRNMLERQKSKYSKGKETAEILCSIDNYYDYATNEPKISITSASFPMTFREHDIVIPMVMNPVGQEVPLSIKTDGSAKEFEVLKTQKFYDGAVWQKIYLQEV